MGFFFLFLICMLAALGQQQKSILIDRVLGELLLLPRLALAEYPNEETPFVRFWLPTNQQQYHLLCDSAYIEKMPGKHFYFGCTIIIINISIIILMIGETTMMMMMMMMVQRNEIVIYARSMRCIIELPIAADWLLCCYQMICFPEKYL